MAPSRSSPQPDGTLTPEVAAWLLDLVGKLTLTVGADDFDEATRMVLDARAQLRALLSP